MCGGLTSDIKLRLNFHALRALRCKVAARRGVDSFDVSQRRSKTSPTGRGSAIDMLKKSTTVERET
jgi:hypothetical protein